MSADADLIARWCCHHLKGTVATLGVVSHLDKTDIVTRSPLQIKTGAP